jgi:hypothetical protein
MQPQQTDDVRAFWSTTAGGDHDRWNVWYRRSLDGGVTWSAPVKLSDAAGGVGYKAATGSQEVYGDYGEIAVTSAGDTFAVWGEGSAGPAPAARGTPSAAELLGWPPHGRGFRLGTCSAATPRWT